MPRLARIDAPGALHHIICRGVERKPIFRTDADRDDFVSRLETILATTETRCYAWALIPNHFHLLLQTGPTPISTVMRRLLTGYAVAFNLRHKRNGHLFQNRYKSIICQDELYLLELIRYIHLNPLRAGLVASIDDLARYPYSGHQQLLGLKVQKMLSVGEVWGCFGKGEMAARKNYLAFVADGIEQGQRPELSGGGLLRRLSGTGLNSVTDGDLPLSDARILGDGEFVAKVLAQADEQVAIRESYRAAGFGLEQLVEVVATTLKIDIAEVCARGKQPQRVMARSLFCFWAVRELGCTATSLTTLLGISQPAVSLSVQRGERLAVEQGYRLSNLRKL